MRSISSSQEADPESAQAMSFVSGKRMAIKELDDLLKVITRSPLADDPVVKLVIYFDAAHVLSDTEVFSNSDKTLYAVMLSVLNVFTSTPLFVLFLSTSPRLSPPAPVSAQMIARSGRAIRSPAHHAPITETPFDCAPSFPVASDKYSRLELGQLEFMAQFGRPL